MRCSQCGMPLSPSRTHCPRCGTPAGSSDKRAAGTSNAASPSGIFGPNEGQSAMPVGTEMPPQPWDNQPPMTPWPPQDGQGATAANQLPFDSFAHAQNTEQALPYQDPAAQNQNWYPAPAQTPYPQAPQPSQNAGWFPNANPAQQQSPPAFSQRPQQFNQPPVNARKVPLGFTIAGVCVILGGILLVFVYVLSQGLPPNTPQTVSQPQATKAVGITPTPTTIATPTLAASPTPNTPAQQYVSNVQMASAVNSTTAAALTPATTFAVKQQTFVTWQLNPQGSSGAICLLWYFNNQHVTGDDFAVDVAPTSHNAYSYVYPSQAGPAYVELYWASSKACTDKQLAQHVNFTVSG